MLYNYVYRCTLRICNIYCFYTTSVVVYMRVLPALFLFRLQVLNLFFLFSCEVRPGPEFLIRSYTFMRNHTFRLLQHHYGDESCTVALYTLTARGRYRQTGRSWVTPGATEAEYTLTRVTVTAQSAEVAEELATRVNTTCPGQVRRRWKPYRDYVVLSLPEERAPNNNQPPVSSRGYKRRNAASSNALGGTLLSVAVNKYF